MASTVDRGNDTAQDGGPGTYLASPCRMYSLQFCGVNRVGRDAMDDNERDDHVRRLDAAEANRLAQELNDGALGEGTAPVARGGDVAARSIAPQSRDVDQSSSPEAATEGYTPLKGEEEESEAGVFPPDVVPPVDIGGSPEEQGVLRDEYRHGR